MCVLFLQADESRIGSLIPEMNRLLRKFLGKFVRVAVIKSCADLTKVDTCLENQLGDDHLAVGLQACTLLAETELDAAPLQKFFR